MGILSMVATNRGNGGEQGKRRDGGMLEGRALPVSPNVTGNNK